MTNREKEKCKMVMESAIRHATEADELCKRKLDQNNVDDYVELLRLQNLIGYAEGVNDALVSIGFKHERMKVLSDLL